MATPLKENVGRAAVARLGAALAAADASFAPGSFVRSATAGLDGLELKARVAHVAAALGRVLDRPFPEAAAVVQRAVAGSGLGMWEVWPVTEWVAVAGRDSPGVALPLLAALTPYASAEFAVRPFVDADPAGLRRVLLRWARAPDEHVRRLASEGSRPRLPWAPRLRVHDGDPGWALPVLDLLYRDPSPYVRRSVANHLNDVSRLDPVLALDVAARWLAAPAATTPALVRHALRTLVKQGDPVALRLAGADVGSAVTVTGLRLDAGRVAVGEALGFSCVVRNDGAEPARVVVDYGLHHVRASGRVSRTVFTLRTLRLGPGEEVTLRRRHRIEQLSVRRHYAGPHVLDLQCNGVVVASAPFELVG